MDLLESKDRTATAHSTGIRPMASKEHYSKILAAGKAMSGSRDTLGAGTHERE